MKRLNELVKIRSGYTFRSSIDSFDEGDVEVIQSSDLGLGFGFLLRPKIKFPGGSRHILKVGEILVSARGYSKATLFRDASTKAVASSSIFVLTPRNDEISSEFITTFFNSSHGMRAIMGLSSGSSVKSITKESLGKIVVPEIPPDKERLLGGAVQAIDDHIALLDEKKFELHHIRDAIITKTLKEAAL